MSKQYELCACPLDCFDVCSMRAEIIDGKVTRLEGNKEHPVTQGFICEKGRKHVERMYHPLRIKQPLKKVNNEFVEISWEEALDTIAGKLKHYIENHGTLSIAQYNDGGAGGLLKNIENLFFDYLGNVTLFKGSLCWGAGLAAQQKDFGDVKGHDPYDSYNTKTIIIWGRNPAETNLHLVPFIKKAREQGAKVVLIDPIKTATAAFSDWHIQLKPNGDIAFALAAAKYMVEHSMHDRNFMHNHTLGFQELQDYLKGLCFEYLLELSGASQETLITFVKEYLLSKPSTIYIGYGLQRYNHGGTAVRAIDMLGALAGIIGITGGGVNYANKVYGRHINWDAAAPAKEPQHRYITKPRLSEELPNLNSPEVKAIFISRSNPAVQLPNTLAAIQAINNINFKVVLDYFMTDTARLADIVLPVTYFMEETDVVYSSMWNDYIHYNEKLVERYHQAKPEFEIYSQLADRLGLSDFPQMSEAQWIDLLLQNITDAGVNIEQLKTLRYAKAQHATSIPWADKVFATPSGKMELLDVVSLEDYLNDCMDADKNSLKLITVHMREALHSQFLMDSNIEYPEVYISNEDTLLMELLKLKDRDLVKLENQYGSIKAIVSITDKCQKGVLFMKQGWWHKNGGSVNRLTPHQASDIGDQATYNECRVTITKLGALDE